MSTTARHWSTLGENTFVLGMNILLGVYRLFGRLPFRLCVYPVVLYYYVTRREQRAGSMDYLRRLQAATGALGTVPTWRHSVRHFLQFAESLLDKMLAVSGRYPVERVHAEGREALLQQLAVRGGGVLVTAHMGCLELCRVLAKDSTGLRVNVLVHTAHAQQVTATMQRLNPDLALQLIEVSTLTPATAVMLRERVDDGQFVAIAGDRVPVSGSHTAQVPFLGHEAPFPTGPYIIAALLECPLFFLGCVRDGPGYLLSFTRLTHKVELPRKSRQAALRDYTMTYVAQLERIVRRAPYDWFNFYAFWDQGDA